MKKKYENYKDALEIVHFSDFYQRQNKLVKTFACKAPKNYSISFHVNENTHSMIFR